MASGYRLASGGRIDRSRIIEFSFNGRGYRGHPGDTLASALIASGVDIIGRSFKYRRPRGFYAAGLEDPNSMLAVRDAHGYEPALRAGQVRLCDGLEARSVTGWPSLNFDLSAGMQALSTVLAAGFYYKTFKWPNWSMFEPWIRRATGFGKPSWHIPQTRAVEHRHERCDVLIVGGGLAGLTAARTLAGSGLSVIIADDQPQLGGSLNWEACRIGEQSGREWALASAAELAADSQVSCLTSTMVTGAYEENHFTLLESFAAARGVRAERFWKVRARHVVLAAGMIDRPLPFANNDRPGIMLSSAVRRLIGEFGVAPARRLVVYTNNDSGYATALTARGAGIDVAAIIDTRARADISHIEAALSAGIHCHFESQIENTIGYRRLNRIVVRGATGATTGIDCDGLAVTGGFTPLIHLATHRGAKAVFDADSSQFIAPQVPAGWHTVGGAAGVGEPQAVVQAAQRAGMTIATECGVTLRPFAVPSVSAQSVSGSTKISLPAPADARRTWIDFQNDVKASDIELAARENYGSVEHLKRYTTLGMGTDQGRTSNVNGLALLANLTGRSIDAVGTTTFRPPFAAIRMATIANRRQGDFYRPRRRLPSHAAHQTLDAVFDDFGWERPDWYRSNAPEREAAVALEMAAVREHVGVFDSSSLGKIEVAGPDAAAFLARCYVSNMATVKPGKVRYSVMLKEDGVIFDDGVVSCLGPNHFLASPTSSNAEAVAAWFERWRQTEWPSMRVAVAAVTSNWASIAVAGPEARALLARLEPSFDISNEAFPHMEIREGTVAGVTARVARISFTGELQYEISVQARYSTSLLEALLQSTAELRPRIVGLEAWMRLRLEKGYLHLGSDTNGRTTPFDVGMAGIVGKRKDDFIGKRSLTLAFAGSAEREQLVGVVSLEGSLDVGARILAPGSDRPPCPTQGYVTSACFSPSLRQWIGLALIERARSRMGETLVTYSMGRLTRCRICSPTFYDPGNERLQA